MSEATSHSAHWVQDDAEITALAAKVTDPAREKLIVCVTTQPSLEKPYVDPDQLAGRLGERVDVYAITTSEHAWALTEALPPKIDVYGGAVRAWTPIPEGKDIYPSDHPQWTVFSADDAPRVIEAVLEYADLAENPPPEFGTEATATVTALRKAGAELELSTGHAAFASNQHLVQTGDVYHSREILNVGQEVQVRVGPWHPQAMRVSVSLRDFAPDPWQRLEEQYQVGQVVEAIVSTIQPYGAFVELLPGAEGLLHKSKIADEFVHYIDDFVRPGDRISVRLQSLDAYGRKAEVTMIDVPEGATPEPLASVYPGGPGWLPDSPDGFGEDEADEAAEPQAVQPWDTAAEGEYVQPDTRAEAEAVATEVAELKARITELQSKLDAVEQEREALRAQLAPMDAAPGEAAALVEAAPGEAAAPAEAAAPTEPDAPQLELAPAEPSESADTDTDADADPSADA